MYKGVLLAVLFLAGAGVAQAKNPAPKPHITSDQPSADRCEGEPHGPCLGRRLTVANPLDRPVVVEMSCDGELLDIVGVIPARFHVVFDLGSGGGALVEGQCKVVSWRFYRGGNL